MYTEEQLRKVIKYVCEYQKATDYQKVANILLADDNYKATVPDIKACDYLADDELAILEIDLKDIL